MICEVSRPNFFDFGRFWGPPKSTQDLQNHAKRLRVSAIREKSNFFINKSSFEKIMIFNNCWTLKNHPKIIFLEVVILDETCFCSTSAPDFSPGPSWDDFWITFGALWDHFGIIFSWFSGPIGSTNVRDPWQMLTLHSGCTLWVNGLDVPFELTVWTQQPNNLTTQQPVHPTTPLNSARRIARSD